jgi:hypothetical protein
MPAAKYPRTGLPGIADQRQFVKHDHTNFQFHFGKQLAGINIDNDQVENWQTTANQ